MSQRDRSRSPRRRSRSRSQRRSRRSYSRERSRSRGADEYRRSDRDRDRGDRDRDRRSRSPMSGAQNPSAGYPGSNFSGGRGGGPRSFEDRSVAKEQMMQSVRESSQQDRRVYVGNLAYDVKWHHLKDFMRQAGEVLFADVLLLPNGMSKGCGIVEYATRDQAQQAIATLSNQSLMGRLVYVREDRETEPRFVGPPSRGDFGGGGGMRGGFHGGAPGGYGNQMGGAPQGGDGRQLYISNLPFNVGWQDLKDLFRSAAQEGGVIRADVHVDATGRPKGTGIVAFESSNDAQSAIQQFNNYDWQGRRLEVRLDRYANTGGGYQGGPGAFGGGFGGRGGYQGGYGGGRGGFGGGRGGFRGGFGGGPGYGGRGGFAGGSAYGGSNAGGYSGGSQEPAAPNAFTDFATSGGERSGVIFVRNLPWSTSNDDLVELFTTIGKVERAEIKYEGNGRSSGTGVVEFDSADNAETAITKFTGYVYGGRPLGLSYVKYTNQNGGDSMDADGGMTQDQMM